MLSVVPANAGTYTAESIVFTRSQTFFVHNGCLWLWIPAFAGTTPNMT